MFTNAAEGIKKIFTAEILNVISTIIIAIAAILPVLQGFEGLEAALPMTLIGGVLAIIAYIMRLVGIHRAAKDGYNFGKAFGFAIIALILTILQLFCSQTSFGGALAVIVVILNIIVTALTVLSVSAILRGLHENKLANSGAVTLVIYTAGYFLGQLLSRMGGNMIYFMANLKTVGILAIITVILSLVGYISYVSFLGKTKNILA